MDMTSHQAAAGAVKSVRTQRLDVAGQKICIDHYPPAVAKKCPVILLHGLGASRFSWRHLAPELAKDRDVYALDLLGFGHSDKPLQASYDVFSQAERVFAVMQQLALGDGVVAGNSMGGGVALAMALTPDLARRQQISGLVLISTIAYPQKMPFYLDLLRKPFLGDRLIDLAPPQAIVRKVLEFGYFNRDKIEQNAVEAYAEALKSRPGRRALVAATKQLEPDNIDDITAQYETIRVPTLILWGGSDHVVPVKNGERLARTMPNAHLQVLPRCGHLAQEECPEAVSKHVKAFLTEFGL